MIDKNKLKDVLSFKKYISKIKKIDLNKIKENLNKTKSLLNKENLQKNYVNTKNIIMEFYKKTKKALTIENIKRFIKEEPGQCFGYVIIFIIGIYFSITLVNINKGSVEAISKPVKVNITENKAEEYYYSGNYDKAVEEYLSIIEKDKDNPLWNVKIAEIYSVKGDIENSKKYVQKAKEQGSKDGDVLNYIVFTEFMNKEYKEALNDGEVALKPNSKNKKLIKTMFTVYMANNEIEKAKALIAAYPVDSKSAYDTAEYSRMLMVLGEWEDGFKKLKAAWEIDKDEYKIYDILAQISVYNKDMLLESVTQLSEKNPNDIVYKMWLAKIYSLGEETAEQANNILSTIKSQDVGKIEIKLIEASVLQNLKQNDKADELISTVIKEHGDDYRVLHTAGWYYLNKKDYETAEIYCKSSIVKNKNYPDNYGFLMPEILKAKGKSLEGEPYFRTAMQKEPYNYNIMLNIANYYWNTTKNSEKALEYFKFAEIIKPMEPEIKYNMALIHLTNKRDKEAIDLLKTCIKLSDITAKYHRTLGTIYMTGGNTAEGIKEIRYAYSTDEADILTLNNAGCYYITVDANLERGLFNLQKAAEGINPNTDKYTSDTIKSNYEKVKSLVKQYKDGKGNETLKIPELTLFY